jgi:hypothetical protein
MDTNTMLNRLVDVAQEARREGVQIPRDRVRDPRWILANIDQGTPYANSVRLCAARVIEAIMATRIAGGM